MSNLENYLFWKLAYFFIKQHGFRMVSLSDNERELWLENRSHKTVQAVRLLRVDLTWSNLVARDIERTAQKGELLRRRLFMRNMTVLNLYISSYEPVDDYSFIEKPFLFPRGERTRVISKIVERQNYAESLARLADAFPGELALPGEFESYTDEADRLKRRVLEEDVQRFKQEKAVFFYGTPFFTYVFMAVQIIVFILMEFAGGSKNSITLIDFGAKFNPLILEGEWWRFLTPMVIHIGFLHLFMNSLALYYLGTVVERIFGNVRFLFIYLVSGFFGTLASFLFSSSLSAGASGAIFGCFGALLYFGCIYPKLFFRTIGLNIILILGINLSFGFTIPGIDNAGHIGGLIGGFLATGIVHFPKKRKIGWQWLFLILTVSLSVASLNYGFKHPDKIVNENAALTLAKYYMLKGDADKAHQYLTSSHLYENDPSPEYLLILAEVELATNRLPEAERHLLQAIESDPDLAEAYYVLAHIYEASGNRKKAIQFMQKAVELDPDNKHYLEQLRQLERQRKYIF